MSLPSTPSPAAHHFASLCQRSGIGTGGHLVRFWVMLSPPHRHTSPPIDQQQGSASTVCHHARLVLVLFPPSVGEGRAEQTSKRKKEREPGRRMPPPSSPVPRLSSVPSAASTVHDLASTSLPSSSAVPVILRPDLVRSLSSVRPSVFLFLVPRSPSCLLTAKANASRSLSHQVTPSPEREGFTPSGSCRDTIATTSTPTSNRDGRTSARPSARLSLPVWYVVRVGRPPSRAGHPFPLTLPTLSTLPGCAWAYGC